MSKRKRYTLITNAHYNLMLYFLLADEEMMRNTTFYVGTALAEMPLPNKIVFPEIKTYTNKELIKYRLRCLKYRWRLSRSEVYAQDHLYFSAPLLDNIPYTVLEDCPAFFTVFETHVKIPEDKDTFHFRRFNYLVGRIYNLAGGRNPYCKNRIITSNTDEKKFTKDNLPFQRFDLQNLWDQSSIKKKNEILKIFGLSDFKIDTKRDVIIFTQPLINDCGLTTEEHLSLYRPIIEKYGVQNVLFKLHPRDNFDYKKAFPGAETLVTKAPQQLLGLVGLKPKVAMTVCSSAISCMNKSTEIIWLGAEVNPRILEVYGHIDGPAKQ